MTPRSPTPKTMARYKKLQKAMEDHDVNKIAELQGELITDTLERGEIDDAQARKMRLELAAAVIQLLPYETREKVTLSLPTEVLKALRLASAETKKDMSQIVSEALAKELLNYEHARLALRKTK